MYVAEIMHAMHSGSVLTSMAAVLKLFKRLISANMHGMCATCVVHRHLKRKVAVKNTKTKLLLKKYAFAHVYTTVRCYNNAWMHSTSVFTSMLAVVKLVMILISGNMYGKRSTCVVHQFRKQKVVFSTEERSFGMKSIDYHMFI